MITLQNILESLPELNNLNEVEKSDYADELGNLIQKTSDLMVLHTKYSDVLNLEKSLSSDVETLKNRIFPSIYFGTAKHHTTKEPYIIARSMWKKGLNNYAQLSAYIGPVANFKNGVKDAEVKKIALDKIRKKIREKFPLEK
jgi:hypothetical protein